MWRRIVCIVMSALLMWSGFSYAVQEASGAEPQGAQDLKAHLDMIQGRLDEFSDLLDEGQVELDELLISLNFDAGEITDFVAHEIGFQAYAGVLRGAKGTLAGRSGNSVDQSILLAKLLKDAGYEARIARGQLQTEAALRLVRSMNREISWPSPFRSSSGTAEAVSLLVSGGGDVDGSAQERFSEFVSEVSEVGSDKEAVIEQIVSNAIPLYAEDGRPASLDSLLIEEQSDYFWVQYRLGPGDEWEAAHPAFGAADPPAATANEYFAESIPEELQHRIRLEVFIETRLGGRVQTHPLMSSWERPAANAAFVPQSLTLLPVIDFNQDEGIDLAAGLSEARFFTLSMNGQLAPGSVVFSLDGLVGPPEASTGPGAFLGTVAEKGIGAAQGLADLGVNEEDTVPVGSLQRLWFEYSLIAPGGQVDTSVREVIATAENGDRIILGRTVPSGEWKEKARIALMQNRDIVLATGPVNPTFSLSRNLSSFADARRGLEAVINLQQQGSLGYNPETLQSLEPVPNYPAFQFLGMANSSTGFHGSRVSYLSRPMLVTFNRGFTQRGNSLIPFEQTDIVFNARRSMEFGADSIVKDPRHAAESGVWDSYFEVLAGPRPDEAVVQRSAFDSLSSRTERLLYVPSTDEARLSELELDAALSRIARNELRAGYGLIFPSEADDGTTAWWRVDGETGTLTAMTVGPGGYGGSTATEYVIKVISISVSLLYLLHGIVSCFMNESGIDLFCCLFDTILTGALIALLTYAITALIVGALKTTGTVMVIGAKDPVAAGLAAKKTSVMVAEIVALFVTVPGRTVAKLSDFRLNVCGSIVGSD